VASALNLINEGGYTDSEGREVTEISWECSCLQKKCGACAMVINKRPRLACDTFLKEFVKCKTLTIEPLRKFPVIRDLVVDRSILFENLKTLKLWSGEGVDIPEKNTDLAYEASRCLQCGCCLEICPNFYAGGAFFGAAGFVPTTRLLTSLDSKEREIIKKEYAKHEYAGCGKSFACANICPAGIPVEKLLVNSNAAMFRRKHE